MILTSRVARRVTKVLTVQHDRVIYMFYATTENRALIHQYWISSSIPKYVSRFA